MQKTFSTKQNVFLSPLKKQNKKKIPMKKFSIIAQAAKKLDFGRDKSCCTWKENSLAQFCLNAGFSSLNYKLSRAQGRARPVWSVSAAKIRSPAKNRRKIGIS